MHLNKFLEWKVDERVQNWVKKTCFGSFLGMKEFIDNGNFQQRMNFITALVQCYDEKQHCFELGSEENKFFLDFGLQDILHISGLPINGNQVC